MIDNIVNCTRKVYEEVESITKVKVFFVVGGFAECAQLNKSLEKEFPGVNVLKPREPGLAVLKGAVMFADDKSVITERRSSRSYGVRTGSCMCNNYIFISTCLRYIPSRKS